MKDLFQLSEKLDELEKLRKSCVHVIELIAGLEAVMILLTVIASANGIYLGRLPMLIYMLPFGFTYTLAFDRRRYKKVYNNVIVRQALENYFEIEEFNSDYGIPQYMISNTGMLRHFNVYKANDYLQGKYKDIDFIQSDVEMRLEANRKSSVTIFKGRWMVFDFNKHFRADMLIYEKGYRYAKHSDGLFNRDSKLQKVEFEDVNFNAHFKAYAQNQNEAFYLLSPQMMEMIEQIRQSVKGDLILIFKDDRLHIGVNSFRDAFEPPIFQKIDISVIMNSINDDIGLITKMVDMLNLDRKIYKM